VLASAFGYEANERVGARYQEACGLTEKTEILNPDDLSQTEDAPNSQSTSTSRKPFVEPRVSFPIDVLEATTFFQTADSGTIPPP
jgi:hypothetical protein